MRIGIDARMYGPEQTGIGIYIRNLIEKVPANDLGNDYVVFMQEPYYSAWQPTAPNVTIVCAPYHWYTHAEQFLFPVLLHRYNLDLVHFPNFNVPMLYRKPYVVTIHDVTPLYFHGHRMSSWWRRMLFSKVFFGGIKNAAAIVAVSQYTKDDILRNISLKKDCIQVIHNGYENRFGDSAKYGTIFEVHARFHITKPYLLYAGVWRNHKNIVGLVEAFAELKKKYGHDLQLVLVGKELPHYPEPRSAWESLGLGDDIILPGFVPDEELGMLYAHAKAYVVPSFSEGFGFNGLEAMSFGVPVASSRATSLPEIYGEAAHYFDPHEPSDMARAIHEVLTDTDLRERLIERGSYLVASYSWDIAAQEHISLYHQILSSHAEEKTQKEKDTETSAARKKARDYREKETGGR